MLKPDSLHFFFIFSLSDFIVGFSEFSRKIANIFDYLKKGFCPLTRTFSRKRRYCSTINFSMNNIFTVESIKHTAKIKIILHYIICLHTIKKVL